MRRIIITTTIALMGSAAATGCGKFADALAENLNEAAQQTAQSNLADEEKLASKLSLVAQCTNGSRKGTYDAFDRIANYLQEDGTPKDAKQTPSTFEMGDYQTDPCNKAAEEIGKLDPSLPDLEGAQVEYTAALTEFRGVNDQLFKYYKQEDFKDDDWAKSKELVPKLVAAFTRFKAADEKLGGLFDAKEDESAKNMLSFLEKNGGKNLEYHSRAYMITAKHFIRCLDKPKPQHAECEAPFKELEQSNTDFRAYFDSHKAEADNITLFSWFESSTNDYYTESKKLMRSLEENKIDDDEIGKVIDEYNELVQNSNRLQFPAT